MAILSAIEEEDLVDIGMKKAHIRLVLTHAAEHH